MRNSLLMLSAVIVFLACGNKSSTMDNEEPAKINKSVLGVLLMDNRNQVIKKIEEQGYKIEENNMFLSVKDKYSFSGFYFDDLSFAIFDAKVFMITLTKEFESEESARSQYLEIEKILNEKYVKFKTNKKNDGFLVYTEFDDKETNLSLSILYKPKEDVPPLFRDSESLHKAREHWELLIMYNPSKEAPINNNKNEF